MAEVWEWLRSCRKCNKPHEWQNVCATPGHPNHMDGQVCGGGTWADPIDGHFYEIRLRNAIELQAEYERTAGRTEAALGEDDGSS